ncbi:uncharacterized protein EURHEDRAFT_376650 [Aspergillus ruber CBS 135680]|uniref:Myb-like domain-containing protein n=1 Tax=Aspergillus ruber (strain CBS 135680) TaxID=1388766 RepID=A0A017SGN2_ASPRC|nr:uncharacterized protein EURHEDRAFT_376650 [Aspergillus ruber CBS 135680]EYE96123.1 hypothetical protein EURHEDRAFT_376650 [Aspergillus ruber CBS 135680]
MARSRSRSAVHGKAVSVPRPVQKAALYSTTLDMNSPPRRRWTRSQSREVESHQQSRDGGGGELDAIEESPAKTQTPPKRISNPVQVQGSPEDAVNMSGTTILPSEPETDLDPDMMIETLPSLEREANDVLHILVPGSVDPVSIVNTAKKLRDPQNPQRKRLKRLMANLDAEAQYFGHHTYVDTKQVNPLLVSALEKKGMTSREWSPDPVLHKVNCARLALEVLLADASSGKKTESQRKVVHDLEGRFPSPFMNELGKGLQRGHGLSVLEKDTFDLALEIRTQSLLVKLEAHQNEDKFDPEAIVSGVFFDDVMGEEDDSYQDGQAPLRGFNIKLLEDENGRLPEKFTEAVYDRVNEIRVTLAEEDDDGVRGLQGAYRWQKFVLRAAQWIRKRENEINRDLQSQSDAEAVREEYFSEPRRESSSFTRCSSSPMAIREVSTIQTVPVKAPKEQVQKPAQEPAQEQVQEPEPAQKPEPAAQPAKSERRKSHKSQWLNASIIERISQRQRRQTDYVRPVSQEKSPETSNRRQTLSGPVTIDPPAPPEPREIPASPENSPTFLQGEEDLFVDSSSHLQPHRGEPAPEKSHSPPMRRQTISIPPNELPTSEEVWNAATKATPRLTAGPQRKAPAAFVDRQEHARRVSPISLSDPRSAERSKERPPQPQPSRKRRRVTDEDDDDDEFSRYERAIDPSVKRAQKPDQSHHIKRRRVDDAPRRERTSPPPSTAPATTTTTSTTTTTDSKVRVRWSSEEDKRLMRLIRECGTSWSDLVRQNHAEPVQEGEVRIEDRDQVQFKDRARNLKIIYYREGRQDELPKQFEYVTMSKRDKEGLRKRGIEID